MFNYNAYLGTLHVNVHCLFYLTKLGLVHTKVLSAIDEKH